jgi:uncharacterized protein YbjT (DUF2867 family)
MILVLGATGTVGSALVRELAARDADFRVMLRSLGRMTFPPQTQIVTGDLADPGSLAPAFHGVERLFLLTPPVDAMVALQTAALDAARAAGVRQVVKLSMIGAGEKAPTHLGRWHARTDTDVRTFPSWTILLPHSFMQNTLAFAPAIRAEGCFYAPTGGAAIPMVDARDVAAVAAECLTCDDHSGESYVLTGPEAIGHGRVAHEIGDAIGRQVRFVDVPAEAGRQGMLAAGYPHWLAEDLVTMMATWGRGEDVDLSHAVRSVAGLVPRSYRTFAQEHAEAFR